jgi:hypothetical protein
MPSVELKTGEYTIPANTTKEFTFWWGSNVLPAEYFDVSIEPNQKIFNMTPLIEERRERAPRQPMLIVTLRNNNNFAVDFFANHIRVHI